MEHRFPLIIGIDAAGIVERVGPGVEAYREGDEVYGYVRKPVMGAGTMADLVSLGVNGLTHKPKTITWEEASVICHSALTAAAAIEDVTLKKGDTLVLLGGTGGVGSFATQFAAERGVEVISVTRPEYTVYAQSMGAAGVVDYTADDPGEEIRARYPGGVDAILDLVGIPDLLYSVVPALKPDGRVASTVLPAEAQGVPEKGKMSVRYTAEHRFPEIAVRIAEGSIRIPAIQAFPFDHIEDAVALQATRHVRGKIAVQIGLATHADTRTESAATA
jgi:NADPH:quinone reductase-like Zn-dependent oxidoreductase